MIEKNTKDAGPNREPKKILMVEDEPIIALAEKKLLEKYGYYVFSAATGEEAVKTALSLSELDLILMDINLGAGINGTEAAQQILGKRDIPLVFLSSHTEWEVVEKPKASPLMDI